MFFGFVVEVFDGNRCCEARLVNVDSPVVIGEGRNRSVKVSSRPMQVVNGSVVVVVDCWVGMNQMSFNSN